MGFKLSYNNNIFNFEDITDYWTERNVYFLNDNGKIEYLDKKRWIKIIIQVADPFEVKLYYDWKDKNWIDISQLDEAWLGAELLKTIVSENLDIEKRRANVEATLLALSGPNVQTSIWEDLLVSAGETPLRFIYSPPDPKKSVDSYLADKDQYIDYQNWDISIRIPVDGSEAILFYPGQNWVGVANSARLLAEIAKLPKKPKPMASTNFESFNWNSKVSDYIKFLGSEGVNQPDLVASLEGLNMGDSSLSEIKELSLGSGKSADLKYFSVFTGIEKLILQHSEVTWNLSSLSSLTKLYSLDLSRTTVTWNLSSLSNIKNLSRFGLSSTGVTWNISSLDILEKLEYFNLINTGITWTYWGKAGFDIKKSKRESLPMSDMPLP